MENEELPQYMRIAGSVAGRIAEGQFAEGEKLSGRSKLSSEYQVSPETIRKAVQLLRDMQVVTVKEQSGVYVRSAENAKRYLQMIGEKLELRRKSRSCARCSPSRRRSRGRSQSCAAAFWTIPCSPYRLQSSCRIMPAAFRRTGRMRGRSLGSLHFWQATGATVVAIRRAEAMFISPGPYAELYGGDLVIFVGDPEAREAVARFSGKRKQHESGRCLPAGRERRHLWFITKFTRSIWPSLRPI